MRALAIAAVVLAPALAAADPRPLYHLNGGVEVEGDGNVSSVAFRAEGLLGTTFGSGPVRPELAAGVVVGDGDLYVPDMRAVDGSLGLSLVSYGPELAVGLQIYDGDTPTTRIFASLAYLRVHLDPRLALDPVPGVGGDRGERAAIGVNFARTEAHHWSCETKNHCDAVFGLLLPQQLAFSVERDGGSTRYGGTISWGI